MHEFVSYIRLKRKENEEKGKKRRREGRKEVAKEGGRKEGKEERKEGKQDKRRVGREHRRRLETIYFRNASLPLKPATRASIKTCHCVKNPVNQSACWLGVPGNSYS